MLAFALPDGVVRQHQLLRVFPEPVASIPVEEAYADLDIPPGKSGRPYTVINAIGSLDGRGAVDGKSTPMGSEVDHRLMRNIRANVDAVLVGAGTLRSEDLTLSVDEPLTRRRKARGLNDQPLPIILTESGNIPADRKLFRTRGGDLLIFTGSRVSQRDLARLSKIGTVRMSSAASSPEPGEILQILADEYNVRRILIEGGPKVNHSFLEARLVDEVFLTLAPKLVGGESRLLVEGEELPQDEELPDLVSIHLSDSEIYLRYRLLHAF